MAVIRKYRGISQQNLADFLSVSQPVISRIETGLQNPTESQAKFIAAHLNIPSTLLDQLTKEYNAEKHRELVNG